MKTLVAALKWILEKWWLLLLITFASAVAYYISLFGNKPWLIKVSSNAILVLFPVLAASIIYLFRLKRWVVALITTFGAGMLFLMVIAITLLSAIFVPDHFTDGLKMPEGVVIHKPYDQDNREVINDSIKVLSHPEQGFIVYDSYQPGIYDYDFWSGKIEEGETYLKAFEATKGTPLTDEDLPKRSILSVGNTTDSIFVWETGGTFTIYEGDWGKPYAARFEVWFRPSNGGAERKLCEKVYKVEGWQH